MTRSDRVPNRIDRIQPSCGWCTRNGQLCEYKERKKPGLRAGYGKELEQRLGKCLANVPSIPRLTIHLARSTGGGYSIAGSFD